MFTSRLHISFALAVLLVGVAPANGQTIPPIGNLTGETGTGDGEVLLAWDTPLFDDPDPAPDFDSAYEFRCSPIYIDTSTWDTATPIDGDIPPIGIDAGWAINLHVDAQVEEEYWGGVYWFLFDEIYMRAWLTAWIHAGNLMPHGFPIRNETIEFYVYDENDNLVTSGSGVTDSTGMADFHTGDINDDHPCTFPDWPLYSFVAFWEGHTVDLSNGLAITTGDREDTEEMMVCDGGGVTSPEGWWNRYGGIYGYAAGGVMYEVFVPPDAIIPPEVQVQFYEVSSPPPPVGMNPGVPGAMVAFMLEKADGPYLNRPVTITMGYPPDKLVQYGGLGESSLQPYRFDDATEQWVRLDLMPITIDRDTHQFRFATDQLGLLAIAAETDDDDDGLGDVEETEITGTLPDVDDSDGDGISDGDELWFTRSDPLDAQKMSAEDQHTVGTGLAPGQGYYIAARIVCGEEQSEVSNCIYVYAGGYALGDVNCDGSVNGFDIDPFVLALTNPGGYEAAYPECDILNADCNGDNLVNGFDIDPFVVLLTGA